jgi:hypothetical protein
MDLISFLFAFRDHLLQRRFSGLKTDIGHPDQGKAAPLVRAYGPVALFFQKAGSLGKPT